MSREEFLKQLEALLSDVSEEERADAMAYYQSYFEDAGEGNEAAILAELESPQKVAESIKRDLGMVETVLRTAEQANATGQTNTAGQTNTTGQNNSQANGQYTSYWQDTNQYKEQQKKESNTVATVLIIILAVLTSPIWLGLVMAVLGVLIGLVATLFGIAVAVVAVMASLLFAGVMLIGGGFCGFFSGQVGVGFALLAAGLIVLALGILAVVAAVWLFGVALPWMVKGIVKLCKMPFAKKKEGVVA